MTHEIGRVSLTMPRCEQICQHSVNAIQNRNVKLLLGEAGSHSDQAALAHEMARNRDREAIGIGMRACRLLRCLRCVSSQLDRPRQSAGNEPPAPSARCGPQKNPKGLQHGFGVAAISAGIPLNMLCQWMGHDALQMDGACLHRDDRDLRQCGRRRGTEHRRQDVGVMTRSLVALVGDRPVIS